MGGEVEQGILRVLTDEGVEGNCIIGDATTSAGTALFDPIINVLKPEVMGRDPADREWLWHRLDVIGNQRGMSYPAWAVLDVALWDIAGKAAGQPIYKLLGGEVRDRIPLYTHPPRSETPEQAAADARENVDSGHRAFKLDPFWEEMADKSISYMDGQISPRAAAKAVEIVAAIREEVGPEIEVLMNNPITPYVAMPAARILLPSVA